MVAEEYCWAITHTAGVMQWPIRFQCVGVTVTVRVTPFRGLRLTMIFFFFFFFFFFYFGICRINTLCPVPNFINTGGGGTEKLLIWGFLNSDRSSFW
jgi:hypothetical protein